MGINSVDKESMRGRLCRGKIDLGSCIFTSENDLDDRFRKEVSETVHYHSTTTTCIVHAEQEIVTTRDPMSRRTSVQSPGSIPSQFVLHLVIC